MEKQKLKENGTSLNLSANDILNLTLNEVVTLENKRKENIGRGNRWTQKKNITEKKQGY